MSRKALYHSYCIPPEVTPCTTWQGVWLLYKRLYSGEIMGVARLHRDYLMQGRSVAGSGWNLEVVREVLGSGYDAEKLALELDHPEFTLPTPRAFVVLMALWWGGTSGKQFPLQTLIQRSWTNVAGQLELLKFATAAPPEVFSFESAQRQLPLAELLQASPPCPPP